MIINLNEKNFNDNIATGLKLVEFSADWCGYCKKQKPILQEMEKVWIGTVDSDENEKLVLKYKITGFPSFILFKDGEEVERFSGLHSKFDIMNIINSHF